MELVFKESEQVLSSKPAYEVEFEASSDFNIPIERPSDGYFLIFQKSISNGKYVEVNSVYDLESKTTIDIDFVGAVYPKWIKIVSEVEPTLAVVTSAGEVTEIKPVPKYYIEYTHQGSYSMEATAKMKEAIDKIFSLTSEFDWVQFNTDEVQIIVKYNVSGEPAREFLMTQTKSYGPTSVYVKNDEFKLGINTEDDTQVILTGQLL